MHRCNALGRHSPSHFRLQLHYGCCSICDFAWKVLQRIDQLWVNIDGSAWSTGPLKSFLYCLDSFRTPNSTSPHLPSGMPLYFWIYVSEVVWYRKTLLPIRCGHDLQRPHPSIFNVRQQPMIFKGCDFGGNHSMGLFQMANVIALAFGVAARY